MSRVSVIIPCYNRASLVREAIESALGQSHPDLEVIVVDDGSTDGSWEAIQAFGERVRGIRVANGGVSRARNIGLAKATGTLVKFLDSDDMLEPEAIARQIRDLDGLPPGSISLGTGRLVDERNRPVAPGLRPIPGPVGGAAVSRATLLYRCISVSFPLFPVDALHAVRGFREDLAFAEDHDLDLRLCRTGYRFCLFDTPSTIVRAHGGGRLTTAVPARTFAALSRFYSEHLDAFDTAGDGPLGPEERVAFAHMIWERGRLAARFGHGPEARRLFALSDTIGGREGRAASRPLKLLYRIADPVIAERVASVGRRVLNRP